MKFVTAKAMEIISSLPPLKYNLIRELEARASPAECGMLVLMNVQVKAQLDRTLGIDTPTLNEMLKELEELSLIRFRTRQLYDLNPFMFTKGDPAFVSRLRKNWTDHNFPFI